MENLSIKTLLIDCFSHIYRIPESLVGVKLFYSVLKLRFLPLKLFQTEILTLLSHLLHRFLFQKKWGRSPYVIFLILADEKPLVYDEDF
jgi:hypothetical protein